MYCAQVFVVHTFDLKCERKRKERAVSFKHREKKKEEKNHHFYEIH